MKEQGIEYVKRTQKDYSMSFKLSVVREYETTDISLGALCKKYGIQSDSSIRRWIDKFGTFDRVNKSYQPMPKSKDQRILELEQRVRLLERQNARLEKELEVKDLKADFFDMMIDVAEQEYGVDIRKKCSPEQSNDSQEKNP